MCVCVACTCASASGPVRGTPPAIAAAAMSVSTPPACCNHRTNRCAAESQWVLSARSLLPLPCQRLLAVSLHLAPSWPDQVYRSARRKRKLPAPTKPEITSNNHNGNRLDDKIGMCEGAAMPCTACRACRISDQVQGERVCAQLKFAKTRPHPRDHVSQVSGLIHANGILVSRSAEFMHNNTSL